MHFSRQRRTRSNASAGSICLLSLYSCSPCRSFNPSYPSFRLTLHNHSSDPSILQTRPFDPSFIPIQASSLSTRQAHPTFRRILQGQVGQADGFLQISMISVQATPKLSKHPLHPKPSLPRVSRTEHHFFQKKSCMLSTFFLC